MSDIIYNKKEFIKKSIKKFGKKLDYSKVEFVDMKSPVHLICSIHGDFFQSPKNHFNGKLACPKCSNKTSTTESFVKKAKKKYKDRFSYKNAKYSAFKKNIEIVCKIHGSFYCTPCDHLTNSNGSCPGCDPHKKLNNEEIIRRGRLVHGNKYDYSMLNYIDRSKKIKIICKEHGVFEQLVSNHFKYGCLTCSGKFLKSQDSFINESIIAHNGKYDYSKVEYKGMFKKVIIICKDHGEFSQIPSNHLHHAKGCSKCARNISKNEKKWLDLLNIPEDKQHRYFYVKVDGKKYFIDGVDHENKIAYEFNGDYWHGNPKFYNQEDIHPEAKVTYGFLYERTIKKQKVLESIGYRVVSIWESDFLENIKNEQISNIKQ